MNTSHVMIIIGDWNLTETNSLQTALIETETDTEYDGVKVTGVCYIDSKGNVNGDAARLCQNVFNELYPDTHDDDLIIKCREAVSGQHAADILCKFISERYDDELQIYFYKGNDSVISYISSKLYEIDSHIYLDSFENGVLPNNTMDKDIYEVMRSYGVKPETIYQGSNISMAYALSLLIYKMRN